MYNISPEEGSVSYHGKAGGQSNPSVSRKELDAAIANVKAYADSAVARIKGFRQEVVQTLPEKGDPATLYFVPSGNPQTSNIHDEYIWVIPDIKKGDTFQAHWEQVGSTAIDHEIVNDDDIGKLVLTIGSAKYAIAREKIVKPAAPTLTAGGDFYNSKSITITASGSTIYYTTDGSTPTTSSTRYTSAFTIGSTNAETTSYTIKAIAVKNGMTSDVASQTYTCYRRVATPTATASGNKYSASRTITFACATADATIEYKVGSNGTWTIGSSVTINATNTVYFHAKKSEWATSADGSQDYTLNAKKCYIGGAGASISSLSGLNGIEADELSGSESVTISSDGYIWFVVPDTATISSITSGPLDVPFSLKANSVSGYNCYRTDNEIAAGTHTFNIS